MPKRTSGASLRIDSKYVAAACVLIASAGAAVGAPPPFTVTSVARTGDVIPGVGSISSAVNFGQGQGQGVVMTSVGNTGLWTINTKMVQVNADLDNAILRSTSGLTAYIGEGRPGFVTSPVPDSGVAGFHSLSMNNLGESVLASGLGTFDSFGDFMLTGSGVTFGNSASPVQAGGTVTAGGLAVGTTWAPLDASTVVKLTDSRRMLINTRVIELGVQKRAVLVLQLSAVGAVTSTTLVAKEGGLVGAGPATWVSIAGGGQASAINNAGAVVFSGTTSNGVSGVYSSATGTLIATQNQATPVAGQNWGDLFGAPVDINSQGVVAIRGRLADGTSVFTETSDAGELMDTAARTFGNGALSRVIGTLSNDHDVDMYRITITDPANFSATTVPDPGSGFVGAAFDTVISIVSSPENGTRAVVQCNDAAGGVVQSTVGGSALNTTPNREYYLCVSTPKARPMARVWHYATDTFPNYDLFAQDPAGVATDGVNVYWPDPSAGSIGRRTMGGAVLGDLSAPAVSSHIAVDGAGGKVYWIDRGVGGTGGGPKIRRSNLDGSAVEDLVTATGFGTITASDATGIALDLVNSKIYWSRSVYGEINRCGLDGSNQERMIQDYPPTGAAFPAAVNTGTFAPSALAVDPVGGKVYWVNQVVDRIERANLDGTGRAALPVGAGATSLALDLSAGHIYWTNTAGNSILRSNFDGSGSATFLTTNAPVGVAVSNATGELVWTCSADRAVRKSPLAGGSTTLLATIAPEIGEVRPNGPGVGSVFFQWARTGSPSGGPLPYQVRLTGATFRHEFSMLVKGSQKVAAVGDVLPGTTPYPLISLGTSTAPIRISDRGDVLWSGVFYRDTTFNNFLFDGLFWNGELLMASMDIIAGASSQKLINLYRTPYAMDMSRNGEWAMLAANMQVPPYNFSAQPDNALLLRFTLPPACPADFNNNGNVSVQDIFDFLTAWFANDPRGDFNGVGGVSVQDIFDFLTAWFSGCP